MRLKHHTRRLAAALLLALCLASPHALRAQTAATAAQSAPAAYRIRDAKGQPVTLAELVEALDRTDVVFVGETHDDAVGHQFEADLLRAAFERYGAGGSGRAPRAVALSLEMFERDVQLVLDEYLAGLINEAGFLASSRPWGNYRTDYRPLVEYARAHSLPVIAANAPARYVTRVNRLGPESLRDLSTTAKGWLPPLPYAPASPTYAAKFEQAMGGGPSSHQATAAATPQSPANPHAALSGGGAMHLLDAQTLRDATMAYALAEFLRHRRGALVVQVNGRFHSDERLGAPEHLKRYRSGARALVVSILSGEGFPEGASGQTSAPADFVILTPTAATPIP